jgi:hypothetical protein
VLHLPPTSAVTVSSLLWYSFKNRLPPAEARPGNYIVTHGLAFTFGFEKPS